MSQTLPVLGVVWHLIVLTGSGIIQVPVCKGNITKWSFLPWSQKTGFMVLFIYSESNEHNFFLPCLKILQKRFKHCQFSWPNPDLEVSRKMAALPSSWVICHIGDLFPLLRITRENVATAKSHWCSAWMQCSPFVTPLLPLCCPIAFFIFL